MVLLVVTFLNTADRLERQLRKDGCHLWGPAVYRCTYGDDAAWETCLERLRASIRHAMRFYNALELLDEGRFNPTAFDNASEFDGANAELVRRHFRTWRERAFREEQHKKTHGGGPDSAFATRATRYKFYVKTDDAALQRIVSPGAESRESDAWVNVVEADWDPNAAAAAREQDKIDHLATDLDLESFEACIEDFPEIDGCTEENIGWMRVHYQDLIPRFYAELRDPTTLADVYVRPPAMAEA